MSKSSTADCAGRVNRQPNGCTAVVYNTVKDVGWISRTVSTRAGRETCELSIRQQEIDPDNKF